MDNGIEPNIFKKKGDKVSADDVIGSIVQSLRPVRPYYPGRIIPLAIVISMLVIGLVLLSGEEIRMSFFELGVEGRLWNLRVLLGSAIFVMSSIMMVDLSVPRSNSLFERRVSRTLFFLLLGVLLCAFFVSTLFAEIPVGFKFKRAYCIEEGIIIGLASIILVSFSLRQSFSPHRKLLLGAMLIFTIFITSNVMDVTCMVSLSHSLRCHLLPILLLGIPLVRFIGSRLKKF
jgi:hypothetical protein